jgi:protein TonB
MKPRSYALFLIVSLALHGLAVWAGVHFVFSEPQYGVELGRSSYAVNLVAGTSEATPTPQPEQEIPNPEDESPPQPEDKTAQHLAEQMPVSDNDASQPVQALPKPKAEVKEFAAKPNKKGNAENNAASVQSSGAVVSVKPDYLSNPPPLYPDSARRKRQEGLVVLKVWIDIKGRSERVDVSSSCGFEALDQEAVRAVKNWRFRAAQFGGVAVRSVAEVPVRFKLE